MKLSTKAGRLSAEAEPSGLCDDEGGGTNVLKLDDALASMDDFVAEKLN